jgi:F1F0 ATPase subunit 2
MTQSFFIDNLQGLFLCLAGGMVLGLFHFGGLWLTLDKFSKARRYGLILAASFLLRSLVTLAGIFVIGNGEWTGMVAALCGVLIMRKIFILKTQLPLSPRVKG